MITITARTVQGEVLAQASHAAEALLRIDRTYEDGDFIEIVKTVKFGNCQFVDPVDHAGIT